MEFLIIISILLLVLYIIIIFANSQISFTQSRCSACGGGNIVREVDLTSGTTHKRCKDCGNTMHSEIL
jgi:DNA-directed RNA polymerase subunit RPC12/RpoP